MRLTCKNLIKNVNSITKVHICMSLASKKYKQHLEAAYTYTSWSEKYYFMNYFLNKLLQMPESNFRYVCVTNKYNHHH